MSTPTRLNVKRKVEIGLAAYVESLKLTGSPIKNYNVFQGSQADDRKLPAILIIATGSEETFPGGPKNVTVEIRVGTQIDDNEAGDLPSNAQRRSVRRKHDDALEMVNEAFDRETSLADIQGLLNHAAVKRPVAEFYFYDITKTDENHATEGSVFVDSISFSVTVEASDNTGSPSITADNTTITCDHG